eukprot:164954_1
MIGCSILTIICAVFIIQSQSQITFNLSAVTLTEGIYNHFVMTHNDTFYVVAGIGEVNGWLAGSDSIHIPLNGYQWTRNPPSLPPGMTILSNEGDAVGVGDKIYMINTYSYSGSVSYHQTLIYDLSTNPIQWESNHQFLYGLCVKYTIQ